jgi:hypothetical protein
MQLQLMAESQDRIIFWRNRIAMGAGRKNRADIKRGFGGRSLARFGDL